MEIVGSNQSQQLQRDGYFEGLGQCMRELSGTGKRKRVKKNAKHFSYMGLDQLLGYVLIQTWKYTDLTTPSLFDQSPSK